METPAVKSKEDTGPGEQGTGSALIEARMCGEIQVRVCF